MHPVLIGPYEEVALTWTNTRHRTRKGSTNAQSVFSSTGFSRTIALLVASFLLQLGCSVQSVQAVAGSKENVHYWYLPTASDIREAREQQRFHKHDPKCVKITSNLAPCDSMQYKSMRMPNLLQQTTLIEVSLLVF
ncbi:secreted frizzled-related protein 1-like [Convolutriloba macropyga]|uniref:secreted frizzled-related protein 1-like n=1 Tax=Convolutriloba macropyga TaxID=536237 RepID=UPI003F51E006